MADNILSKFASERETTLQLLTTEPEKFVAILWTSESPLPIDRGCMWRPGSPEAFPQLPRGIRKSHACSQCRYLERLVDLNNATIGNPFLIEAGSEAGKELVVDAENTSHLSTKMIVRQPHNIASIESDSFTNHVLISWILEDILNAEYAPNIKKLYSAFICGTRGYLLSEATQPVKAGPSKIRDIVIQLIATLVRLHQHHFIHGNPSLESLQMIPEPVSYLLNESQVTGAVTLKLSQFHQSCVMITTKNDIKLQIRLKQQLPRRHGELHSAVSGESTYHLTTSLISGYKHHGVDPIYESLEGYAFMMSLLLDEELGRSFLSNESLRKVFESMWVSEELPKVLEEIEQEWYQGTLMDVDAILDFLKPFTLYRNVVERLWDQAKLV